MNRTQNNISQQPEEKRPGTFASLNVSKDKKTADLEIWDIIGDAWDGTTARQFIDQIKALPKSVNQINVSVSSPGGGVWQAIEMYQALKDHPAQVTTRVNSIAASAAVMPLMAGDVRIIGPHASVMIHKPYVFVGGDADSFREVADRLDRDQESIVDIYMENGLTVSRDEVTELMNNETWMDANEAVALGFGTEMSDDLEVAACVFDLDSLKGCPAHHKNVAKAIAKRNQENAQRDAGKSRKDAKAIASGKNERDAQVDVTEWLCREIAKEMEVL